MKLVNSELGFGIDLLENEVNVIVVESPEILSQMICGLKKQISGEPGQFVLSENDICRIDKFVEIIVDPWAIDFNSKRIKTKLLQLIKEEAEEGLYDKYLETKGMLCQYAENILDKMSYSISYDMNFDTMALVKFLDFKINMQTEKLIDAIIEYIKLLNNLCKIEIVVLVNIKAYLTSEELFFLYKESMYQKIHLILIESVMAEKMDCEKIVIIDADKCIINI